MKISVSNYSSARLIFADNKWNKIIFDMYAWKDLIRTKYITDKIRIYQLVDIGNTIESKKCHIRRNSSTLDIYITIKIMYKMCIYECFVDNMYSYITENLHVAQTKYNQLKKIFKHRSDDKKSKYFN